MKRVRMKDLALVAAAGGLLAFEIVALGRALPTVRDAVVDRLGPAVAGAASLGRIVPRSSAAVEAGAKAAQAVTHATVGTAHTIASAAIGERSPRRVHAVNVESARCARMHLRIVTVEEAARADAIRASQLARKRMQELHRAVEQAVRQATS